MTISQALDQVVGEQLTRLAQAWPQASWSATRRFEYRSALLEVQDANAIEAGVTKAIRGWGGQYPPSVANLLEIVRAEAERRRLPTRPRLPDPGEHVPSRLDEIIPNMPPWIAEVMERTRERMRSGLQ